MLGGGLWMRNEDLGAVKSPRAPLGFWSFAGLSFVATASLVLTWWATPFLALVQPLVLSAALFATSRAPSARRGSIAERLLSLGVALALCAGGAFAGHVWATAVAGLFYLVTSLVMVQSRVPLPR